MQTESAVPSSDGWARVNLRCFLLTTLSHAVCQSTRSKRPCGCVMLVPRRCTFAVLLVPTSEQSSSPRAAVCTAAHLSYRRARIPSETRLRAAFYAFFGKELSEPVGNLGENVSPRFRYFDSRSERVAVVREVLVVEFVQ